MTNTMLAVYHEKYGGPSVMKCGQIPMPDTKVLLPGEILVKVRGASINPVDYKLRTMGGIPFYNGSIKVFGNDFSGIVAAEKDTQYNVGDSIFGRVNPSRPGTLAEYLIVDADICCKKPKSLSHTDAASLPLVGITAVNSFRKCGMVEHDTHETLRVLILGGAGGVGSCAIQLAKGLYNASFVATTASPGVKAELVRSLGADFVANHREKDLESQLAPYGPFNVIIDCVGDIGRALSLVKEGGSVVSIATATTAEALGTLVTGNLASMFISSKLGAALVNRVSGATKLRNVLGKKSASYNSVFAVGSGEVVELLRQEVEGGRLVAVVDSVFKLKDGIQAMARLEGGHATGKIVIDVDDGI